MTKVVFIMHMPQPVHGAALVGKYIHDSELVNNSFDCHYVNLTTAAGLEDVGKPRWKKLGRFVKLLRTVRKTLREVRPDVVYLTPNACGGAFYKDYIVVQMVKGLCPNVVLHYHNKGVSTRQGRWFDNKLYKRFFKGVKVILLAETLYEDVKKYVNREDVFICPNGIPETLREEPSAQRHNAVPRLLFLSNLLASKGVFVLLDACKMLKEKGYSFVCDIVGGETAEIDAARLDREISLRGLNEVAFYKGRKYGADKHTCLEKADIFVFPTFYFYETFGLVNLEAMEHKVPVVATDEGGIRDVVKNGENGLIAKRQSAGSIAACIEKLLNDPATRERMGEDGYRKFKENFTLDKFEVRLSRCISDCCATAGGGILNLVLFHGKQLGAEKAQSLECADIFVFPTYYPNECFPLVLLEAMEHGLPCVSTNEGGIAEIIEDGENGLISEKKSPESLAQCIERLLTDEDLRQRLGANGRKTFKEKYTYDVFEHRLSLALKSIAGEGER